MGKGASGTDDLRPRRSVEQLCVHIGDVAQAEVDPDLLQRALTHRSYAYEAGGLPHNERLEFLGDSVLGVIVTDALYTQHPDATEGMLAKFRAAVVNMRALAEVGRTLNLGDYVYLGRGEESTGGRNKDSILADAVEAIIGAVYVSTGMPAATRFVRSLVNPLIAEAVDLGAALDWKTSLQEVASRSELGAPTYEVSHEGPEHEKSFTATVCVGDRVVGSGTGRTKKIAEQHAAEQAFTRLQAEFEDGPPTAAHA